MAFPIFLFFMTFAMNHIFYFPHSIFSFLLVVQCCVVLTWFAFQNNGLTPILCVGETKQQRDAGETEKLISYQLEHDLVDIDQTKLVIAYEPIWAIGTGDTCESAEANRVIGLIRTQKLLLNKPGIKNYRDYSKNQRSKTDAKTKVILLPHIVP